MIDGLKLLILGVGIVFIFLIFLSLTITLWGKLLALFIQNEKDTEFGLSLKSNEQIAVITAALTAYRGSLNK